MKRNIVNPIQRFSRYSCGSRRVAIPSSLNQAAQLQSFRAVSSSNVTSIGGGLTPFSRGARPSFTSAEDPTKPWASKSSSYFFGAVSAALGAAVAFDVTVPTSMSQCDAPQDSITESLRSSALEEEIPIVATRPLWPGGVSEEDVDALVEIILEDPTINIQLLPDAIEAIIYKSAVKLTANLFYKLLAKLNGMPLLSHQIQVARLEDEEDREALEENKSSWFSEKKARKARKKKKYRRIAEAASMKRSAVNDEILNTIAERLLENQVVNSFLPDKFEFYLYQGCLKVVFRTLQILSHTFHINLCGHNICILIEPSTLEQSALTAASSLNGSKSKWMDSEIDMKMLEDFASTSGINDESYLNDENLSWWDRFWLRRRRKMIAKLHASLYGLLLGIIDDILQHSSVKILSDDIFLDITPTVGDSDSRRDALPVAKKDDGELEAVSKKTSNTTSSSKVSFMAGIGVGAGLMFLLSGTQ